MGEHAAALAIADELADCFLHDGLRHPAECNFYHSLAMTGLHASASPAERAHYDAALTGNQERMRAWMESCPLSFAPMYLLVEAERARLARARLEALVSRSRHRGARHAGFPHVEAIACERAMLGGSRRAGRFRELLPGARAQAWESGVRWQS
jgi:hypothetical protein